MESMRRLVLVIVGVGILFGGCKSRKTKFVTIGTGAVTGIYYPTGGAISQMVNRKVSEYGIKATVEATSGSVFNINAVMNGDLDFGIAQSDRQYLAYHGLAEWSDSGRQEDLRSVFSVHPESITLVASVESGTKEITDLRGKRVNLGNPGSGHLQNTRDVLKAVGLNEDDLSAEHVKAVEAPGLLQDERIDAFFYTVGHPNSNIEEATFGRVKVFIVPIRGPDIDKMLQEYPYYAKSTIPRSLYPNASNTEDVATIGVKTTFVTSANVDEDVVYAVTREVFENFEHFKSRHAAYQNLTKEDMLKGLSAPIHPGALKYYREAGLDRHIHAELIVD
ncbi:MAG: TAXI family TRAP transporter solute-binding subunit [Phycisphaerales bacterium]|nr:MAG: TAXI family TRAP transporter solute-binding subunit [Phycisphaerales bacterium]